MTTQTQTVAGALARIQDSLDRGEAMMRAALASRTVQESFDRGEAMMRAALAGRTLEPPTTMPTFLRGQLLSDALATFDLATLKAIVDGVSVECWHAMPVEWQQLTDELSNAALRASEGRE